MAMLLTAARALHFVATVSLAGGFAFDCLIAVPAVRRSGDAAPDRWLQPLAWASLAVALASGALWLVAIAAEMSGKPVAAALAQGVVGIVLTGTRFGEDWLWRAAMAALLAVCLVVQRRWPAWRLSRWAAFGLAMAMLASLAWAGHGGATPGAPGDLHLAADIVHLGAAGLWLGTLLPLALFLAAARRHEDAAAARLATRRYSALAATSVLALLAGGLVNTWFLAGTVPALIGTEYGRLLLLKIALFAAMLLVAAVNLQRLGPRLGAGPAWPTVARLQRNALAEAALGLAVLAIVGILGTMPPGLHEEPGWPLPFRIDTDALPAVSQVAAAMLLALAAAGGILAVTAAASGRYRRSGGAAIGVALCLGTALLPLRPAIEAAYPTSFYAPAQPYAAPSIARGAAIYAENCALCHGAGGHGDGPAAAQLPVRPADLTQPHLFAHSPGDLFWWVSRGRADGVMPGFAAVLAPGRRWDVINFVRARAAGVLAQQIGPQVAAAAAPQVPDFAFETGGTQKTLARTLEHGPALLVLFAPPAPRARLRQLASAGPRLQVIAVELGAAKPDAAASSPSAVAVSPEVAGVLGLFRNADDGGESELLLDRAGAVRVRWTASALAATATLLADAAAVARFPAPPPSHAAHAH